MRTTVTLSDELAAHVDEIRPSADDSDAEAMRECVRRSQRLDEVEAELQAVQDDLDSKQARVDDLQRQLMAANQRIDTTNELVERVESVHIFGAAIRVNDPDRAPCNGSILGCNALPLQPDPGHVCLFSDWGRAM